MNSGETQVPGGRFSAADAGEMDQLARYGGLLVSQIGLYGLHHESTKAVIRTVYHKLSSLLPRLHRLDFAVEQTSVKINGVAVARRNPVVQAFATHLLARDISGFSLNEGLTEAQFNELVEVLGREETQLMETGGFGQALATKALGASVSGVELVSNRPDLTDSLPPPLPAGGEVRRSRRSGEDYYTSGFWKFSDFILGMFGFMTVQVGALVGGVTVLGKVIGQDLAGLICGGAQLLFLVGIPVFAIKTGRKYIAFGYLVGVGMIALIPLLLLGACLLMLAGYAVK